MLNLIINADDFGYSTIFNESILDLAETGLITSTTVMVNHINNTQIEQINKLISFKDKISIGLHLEFLDEEYLEQIDAQVAKFIDIFSFKPSHIDVHKPSSAEGISFVVYEYCSENNFACRNIGGDTSNVKTTDSKAFFGSVKDFQTIKDWISSLNEGNHEILFHPGKYDSNCKSSLNKDRERDIEHIKKLNKLEINFISYNMIREY